MTWVVFVAGAVLSWGVYGAMLHQGQQQLGNPLKALLCVGGWNSGGTTTATIAGILGAAGAGCIIWSFRSGGIPLYVMPLVFGGAPIVNVLYSMIIHPPKAAPNPMLYVGFLLASLGAGMVLYFRPTA